MDLLLLFATADDSNHADYIEVCVAVLPATAVIAADDKLFAVDFYNAVQDIAAVGRTIENDVVFFQRLVRSADNNRVSPLFEEWAHTFTRGVNDDTAEGGYQSFIR